MLLIVKILYFAISVHTLLNLKTSHEFSKHDAGIKITGVKNYLQFLKLIKSLKVITCLDIHFTW